MSRREVAPNEVIIRSAISILAEAPHALLLLHVCKLMLSAKA